MPGQAQNEEKAGAVFLPPPAREVSRKRGSRSFVAAALTLIVLLSAWRLVGGAAVEHGSSLVRAALAGPDRPELRNVLSEVTGPLDDRTLVVSGEIANGTSRAMSLRPLEFLVRNGDEQVLVTWTSAPPRPTLPPGETVRFEASLAAPPRDGREVQVHFTKARGVAWASRSPL